MTICCPGPPKYDLAWTPCTASEPLEAITGYAGIATSTRGERCPVSRLTWTSECWTHDNYPAVGDRVTVNGQAYFVDAANYFGCTVILQLCRPVIECPDCTATVVRLARAPATPEFCADDLFSNVIASDVPASVCITEQVRRIIDNAELQIVTARICLDTLATIQVGDLVVCGIDVWRIDRIESPCSSTCLLTLIAIKEPWKIFDEVDPGEPQNYTGQALLDISSVDVDIDAVAGFPPLDVEAELHIDVSAVTFDIVAVYQAEYHGTADLGLPAVTIDAAGSTPPKFSSDVLLDISGAQIVAAGLFVPELTSDVALDVSGAQLDALGTVDLPPINYDGSADLQLITVTFQAVAEFIETAVGTSDLDVPAATLTGTGIVDVPFVYIGTADECPPWETFSGELFETFSGEPLEFSHDCGFQIAGASLSGTGTVTWSFAGGDSLLSVAGAQLMATGLTTISEQYQGNTDMPLVAASLTSVGVYTLGPQYIGAPGPCGPWTTETDEIITDENDVQIEFVEPCEFILPAGSVAGAGLFAVEGVVGTTALQTTCAVTAGFVSVAAPPPTIYTGTADSLDISGATIDALGDYTDPVLPPQVYTGTSHLGLPASDIVLFEGTVTGTEQVVVGMMGGSYIDYGFAPSVIYPLTDPAIWRWDNVVPEIDDRNAMLLSTPLAMDQGKPTTDATLIIHGDFFGFNTPMEGTITAWDVDNAPAVDQNWTPDQVLALPRTTASVDISLFPGTQTYVAEVDVTAIVNEIIMRPGWTSGNRIMFFIETNDKMLLGDKYTTIDTPGTQLSTRLVIEPPVLETAPWTRANYWYFENIEAGCTQGSADPLLTSNATEMILRTQDSCPASVVRRWALGLAVRDLNETVNAARIRLDTTALGAGNVPYNTTSVTAYYELSSFTEGTYTADILRTNLQPAGGMQIPWHWSYGENAYVIDGFGPLIQAAQQDPAYVLGQPFRIVLVPDDAANWDDDPAHPIQGHQVNSLTPQLQYFQAGDSTTLLTQPSWLDETEDYPEPKIGVAYDANTYETILNIDNPISVSTSQQLIAAVAQAKSTTAINAIFLAPGTYSWPIHLLNGLNRDPQSVDPLVIMTAPGSTTQAKLQGPNGYVQEERAMRGVCFVDLDISDGLVIHGQNGMRDILIERCTGWLDIQGGRDQSVPQQKIPGTTLVLPINPIKNVIVRLNDLSNNWRPDGGLYHGLYGYNIESMLVEGNIFDHNGWSDTVGRDVPDNVGGASGHKHNIYINPAYPLFSSRNIVIRYNFISRASSHGIQGKVGANIYRNLFVKNPIACQQGFGGDQQYVGYGVRQDPVFRDNVCIDAADIDNTNPRGVGLWTTCVDNLEFRRNLFLDNTTSSTNNETYWLERDFPIEIAMSDNRSVNWTSVLPNRGAANFAPVIVENIGNDYSGNSLSPTAQTLANSLKLDANIEALKTARYRRGVDINQLRADMQTLQDGVI